MNGKSNFILHRSYRIDSDFDADLNPPNDKQGHLSLIFDGRQDSLTRAQALMRVEVRTPDI